MRRLNGGYGGVTGGPRIASGGTERLKVAQIVTAAAIPVVAAFGGGADVAGLLGALVVVVEGLQQLFQFQQNWLRYRSAAQRWRPRSICISRPRGRMRAHAAPLCCSRSGSKGLLRARSRRGPPTSAMLRPEPRPRRVERL